MQESAGLQKKLQIVLKKNNCNCCCSSIQLNWDEQCGAETLIFLDGYKFYAFDNEGLDGSQSKMNVYMSSALWENLSMIFFIMYSTT